MIAITKLSKKQPIQIEAGRSTAPEKVD